jgi:hypothetical protein
VRADQHASGKVTQHRSDIEHPGERGRYGGGGQENDSLQKIAVVHRVLSRSSLRSYILKPCGGKPDDQIAGK